MIIGPRSQSATDVAAFIDFAAAFREARQTGPVGTRIAIPDEVEVYGDPYVSISELVDLSTGQVERHLIINRLADAPLSARPYTPAPLNPLWYLLPLVAVPIGVLIGRLIG